MKSGPALLMLLGVIAMSALAHEKKAERSPLPRTEAECVAAGGTWAGWGLPFLRCEKVELGTRCEDIKPKSCQLKTTDAGVPCTDSAECQGHCMASSEARSDTASIGACSDRRPLFSRIRE